MKRADRNPFHHAAADIRERGIAPGRDLWPGIAAAIDQQEKLVPVRRAGTSFSPWARLAAAVAVLALMASVPVIHRPLSAGGGGPAGQGLAVIDQALAEVNGALIGNPDNGGLTRHVLQLHQRRAELMRRTVEDKIRSF